MKRIKNNYSPDQHVNPNQYSSLQFILCAFVITVIYSFILCIITL